MNAKKVCMLEFLTSIKNVFECVRQKTVGGNAMELVNNELNIQVFQSDSAFWRLVYTLQRICLWVSFYSRKKTKFLP